MKKVLYITSDPAVRSRVDGPSLLLRREGEADRRFPLCRIRRIVCFGSGGISWPSLLACADAGIPVASLKTDGTPRALWCPVALPPFALGQAVEEWLAEGDWRSSWTHWCESIERQEITRASWACRVSLTDWRPAAAYAKLAAACHAANGNAAHRLLPLLRGILHSHIGQRLIQAGLDPQFLAGKQPGFDPVGRFAAILHWRQLGDLAASPRAAAFQGDIYRLAVKWYEIHAAREDARISNLLDGWSRAIGGVW